MFVGKKEKKDSQKKLALVGMKHGVGTTHIGMLLANYFGQEKSVKTAYVEWNKTGAFSKLCESIYGYKKEVFCIQNVDYFAYQSEKELEQAVLEKYDYIIFDFGVELKNNKEKMRGCEETLFIGNLERWNKKDYVDFQKQYDEYCGNLGKFVCNFGREDMIRQVEKTIHKKINFIGYQPINQPLKGEIEQFFYSLK